jgi:hypothetical protein
MFRGEGEDEWIKPKSTPGTNIKNLQTFLQDHGFMPGARLDGVFGYWTLGSLRLFQEYIRTIEGVGGIEEVGMPDGRVWKNTHKHMMRWQAAKHYCTWERNKVVNDNPKKPKKVKSSKEYDLWLKLLTQIKDGTTNWSAGCQVISGRSYINNEGKLIDCSTYSAAAYSTLSAISQSGVRRSRGAYTFVSDFILAYSKADTDHVLYTLCNDEAIDKFGDPKLQALLALQSQSILDQFEKEEEKGMIAGFIKQMKESKNIIKKPKA